MPLDADAETLPAEFTVKPSKPRTSDTLIGYLPIFQMLP